MDLIVDFDFEFLSNLSNKTIGIIGFLVLLMLGLGVAKQYGRPGTPAGDITMRYIMATVFLVLCLGGIVFCLVAVD